MTKPIDKRLKELEDRINQYDMRFPGVLIAEATGYDEGYISAVLNGKKPISDKFWSSFEEKFPAKVPPARNKEADASPALDPLQALLHSQEERIKEAKATAEEMKAHYNDMRSIVENNLNIILASLGQNGEAMKDLKMLIDLNIKQGKRQDDLLLKIYAASLKETHKKGSKAGKTRNGPAKGNVRKDNSH